MYGNLWVLCGNFLYLCEKLNYAVSDGYRDYLLSEILSARSGYVGNIFFSSECVPVGSDLCRIDAMVGVSDGEPHCDRCVIIPGTCLAGSVCVDGLCAHDVLLRYYYAGDAIVKIEWVEAYDRDGSVVLSLQ